MMQLNIAIAWCLVWGNELQPSIDLKTLHQMRQAMVDGSELPKEVQARVERVHQLNELAYPQTLLELKSLADKHYQLWDSRIGLVYGGATKIKQYVFEASKLQDIRGASALLDRINLIDLPAFFKGEEAGDRFPQCVKAAEYCRQIRTNWLREEFPGLEDALIPELIIYSTGGNILAFCPVAYVEDLANAIEKRYTHETLTANACAVGQAFRFLELRFGLLKDNINQTPWLDWYLQNATQPLVEAIYGKVDENSTDQESLTKQFKERKSFNELVRRLAVRFNQRRSGNDRFAESRPSRRYPPMFETHPYGRRDGPERRLAVNQARQLPGEPWFSDVTARKRIVGQKVKRENQRTGWFSQGNFGWEPGSLESWTSRFQDFLMDKNLWADYNPNNRQLEEARSLREIGNASSGFVAYIYADGNNMGGYIQKITTAQEYQEFSDAVSQATEHAVYYALKEHLEPHQIQGIDDPESENRNGTWIHPFEILTIGGDDVMLVVPANKALAIAQTLSKQFEALLLDQNREQYGLNQPLSQDSLKAIHRYRPEGAVKRDINKPPACKLSMSAGVLITAENTPIYYAENLTNQLLKSAKSHAKHLKKEYGYYGGTIDFLTMKAVTMLSSNVKEFREAGLVFGTRPKLKLYGAPYTLHEIEGLLETAKALKKADFPRSQLYQIRSLLERGKHTAMLNYRYFWSRLNKPEAKDRLKAEFEDAWCKAKTNDGNLVPWIYVEPTEEDRQNPDYVPTYETIWRELVDLYPFIEEPERDPERTALTSQEVQ
jgi:CRISPR-associated protein Cmr2